MIVSTSPSREKTKRNKSVLHIPYRDLEFPDFNNLRFDIYQSDKFYLAYHATGHLKDITMQWPEPCFEIGWEKYYSGDYEETGWQTLSGGPLHEMTELALHPSACAMHYAPATFEGAKAMITSRGRVVLFRGEANAQRMQRTASRLLLPKVPIDMFMNAMAETVLANRKFMPPFRKENWDWETRNPMCMYVRPLLFGHGPELGVKPAKAHLFMVFVSPVKAYWPTDGIRVLITDYFHRAAPGGIGHVKAIGNYASGLLPSTLAKRGFDWKDGKPIRVSDQPFQDVLYLDAVKNQFIEEFSGANFVAVTTDGTVVFPKSDSILPGNTSDSLMTLARDAGLKVEHRPISVHEVMDESRIAEAFCTGNAAIIAPIAETYYKGKSRTFQVKDDGKTRQLWDLLVGIQFQMLDDPYGWVKEIG